MSLLVRYYGLVAAYVLILIGLAVLANMAPIWVVQAVVPVAIPLLLIILIYVLLFVRCPQCQEAGCTTDLVVPGAARADMPWLRIRSF